MEWNDSDIDLLERYASDELSDAERQALEEKIASNPEFAEEAAKVAEAISAMKAKARAEEKEKLRALWQASQETSDKTAVRPLRRRRFWGIAASVILIAAVGFALLKYNSDSPKTALYHSLYQPLAATPVVRDLDQSYAQGMKAYREGDYDLAAQKFKLDLGADSLDADRYLYLGNCALNTEDFALALEYFDQAKTKGTAGHRDHAEWFGSLAHLRLGEKDMTRQIWEEIAIGGGPYASLARDGLEKLEPKE